MHRRDPKPTATRPPAAGPGSPGWSAGLAGLGIAGLVAWLTRLRWAHR